MELLGLVMHSHNEDELRIASRTLAEVVTIFVFLVVGAALPFATLADHWAPSLAVVAVLLLVARPVAVLACTLPDRRARWTRPELAFLCWTRETGVVPAALVGVLAGLGVPERRPDGGRRGAGDRRDAAAAGRARAVARAAGWGCSTRA